MLIETLFSFLPYMLVTAFTPGPNNILAFNAISNRGWKAGKFLVMGIAVGFLCVMLLCALACFELSKVLPALTGILKYVGAVYMVWLAIHVALSRPGGEAQTEKNSFWAGFFLQFVNVKIILGAITVYTGYILPVSQSLVFLMIAALYITSIGVCGTMTWALAGKILQKYMNRHYKVFNRLMGLVLLWSALTLILH